MPSFIAQLRAASPRSLLETCLDTIEAREPALHAFITLDPEAARAAADAATARRIANRPLSPIDGMPVAIKDLTPTAGIRTTWFIPGFTIESWPKECAAVVADGHEVAHHSWAHVPPANQTREQEEADLVRANNAITKLTGRKARGKMGPSSNQL